MHSIRPLSIFLGLVVCLNLHQARAAVVVFTIDPSQSWLEITPSTSVFGSPVDTTEQASGSLITSYSGSIFTNLSSSTIEILSPSTLVASNSGSWLPGSDYSDYPDVSGDPSSSTYLTVPEPANYGIVTDLTILGDLQGVDGLSPSAIRGLEIAIADTAPKAITGGMFDESGILTNFTSGTVYLSSGGVPPVSPLTASSPEPTVDALGTGTISESAGVTTLTIPVNFTVTYDVVPFVVTSSTTYNGVIVATAFVPEPAGISLVGVGLGLLLSRRKRHS